MQLATALTPPAAANLLLIAVGAITGLATLSGGLIALALRKHLHLILGFSAGAIMGVALLELLPEASRVAGGRASDMGLYAGVGFMAYLLIDRLPPLTTRVFPTATGHLGPASLTAHSLLDGLAIALAFQASSTLGLAVATAVIAHDLSDGANTVNLGLVGGGPGLAFRWLLADAAAPVLGIAIGRLANIPNAALAPLLAVFAGSFLYIGAGKLIAESYRRHPHLWTSLMSALGFVAIYLIARVSAT
jgi:ZIP family zinc transporter